MYRPFEPTRGSCSALQSLGMKAHARGGSCGTALRVSRSFEPSPLTVHGYQRIVPLAMPFPSALILLLSLLAAAAPAAALAQVYKWVDENGVVNYGDKPPARGKPVKPLAENGGSVSVVPGMPKEELEQMRQRDMQRRVQQLENEVDELRARSMARDNAAAYPMPAEVYVPAGYGYDYGYGWGYGRRALYPPVAQIGRAHV